MEPIEQTEVQEKPSELTAKARRTREHIVETALALFAERGYQETTLRDIAAAAGVSLGLTYRYFSRKEELILTLYERLAQSMELQVQELSGGTMAERFELAFKSCLERLTPHRDGLGALFAVGLAADSEVAVLGDGASGVRNVVWNAYYHVVTGATDKPKERQAAQITTLFYTMHLLFVLLWLQDRSHGQRTTHDLLQFVRETLGQVRPLLGLSPVAKALTRLTLILSPLFGPSVPMQTTIKSE